MTEVGPEIRKKTLGKVWETKSLILSHEEKERVASPHRKKTTLRNLCKAYNYVRDWLIAGEGEENEVHPHLS